MPTLVGEPPDGDEWLHELKSDGYRTQIILDEGRGRAFTRNGHNWTAKYRPTIEAALALPCGSAIIDGEMVVATETGHTDFHAIKATIAANPSALVLMAFDLLHLDGRDLRQTPLIERRLRLEDLVGSADTGDRIQFSDHVIGNGSAVFAAAEELGVEGIVSKKINSRYRSGYSKAWLKIKSYAEGEFVVIRAERGDKAPVALLAREAEEGLEYAGAAMVTLADPEREIFWETIERLKTDRPPVPMEERKEGSWLWPELKVRVKYLRGEEMLRHATVQGIADAPAAAAVSPPSRSGRSSAEPTYPKPEISKAAVLDYYRQVAPLMLPWLVGRPLNLFRCVGNQCFFQRNENHPVAVDIFHEPIRKIPVDQKNGKTENYLFIEDAAGLIACAKADAIEFHAWGSRVANIERPDRIAFDLDPDVGLPFELVKNAALQVRRSLNAIGLESFAMLTGGKGVHVVLPFAPKQEWPAVRRFAKEFCEALASADPDRFTVNLPKAKRKGRIFLDYLRNQRTATAIMPYSARARPGLPVAAPIGWAELEELSGSDRFKIGDVAELVERRKRPELLVWGEAAQSLPRL